MDTQSVWDVLSAIPIGTIVAWVVVILAIITAICTAAVKLYKVFSKYKELKDRNEKQIAQIQQHEELLKEINSVVESIKKTIMEEKEVQGRRLRHDITKRCNRAIEDGHITLSMLKSIDEMFEDYDKVYKQNHWVHQLVDKVHILNIIKDIYEE